eukprot:gene12570-14854_t
MSFQTHGCFDSRKEKLLADLIDASPDKSPKGYLDAPILTLVELINSGPNFCTTSSCSGRVRIADGGNLTLRFEPFILAVECRSLEDAALLNTVARQAGYRESGISSVSKRIAISVRSSIRLEVPIVNVETLLFCFHLDELDATGKDGKLFVDDGYLRLLVDTSREKFVKNVARIDHFSELLAAQLGAQPGVSGLAAFGAGSGGEGDAPPGPPDPTMHAPWVLTVRRDRAKLCKDSLKKAEVQDDGMRSSGAELLWGGLDGACWVEHREQGLIYGLDITKCMFSSGNVTEKARMAALDCRERIRHVEKASAASAACMERPRAPCAAEVAATLAEPQGAKSWVLHVAKARAKLCKDALKRAGHLDLLRKAEVRPEAGLIAFPITREAAALLADPGAAALPTVAECVRAAAAEPGALRCDVALGASAAHRGGGATAPAEVLRREARALLEAAQTPAQTISALLEETPHRWERLGDAVLLPRGAFKAAAWRSLGSALWPVVAAALRVKHVARQ